MSMTEPTETTPESTETDETVDPRMAGVIEARDRYNRERDEARAERDALAARIETLQRAEVERLASAGLSHPEDLFSLSGNTVADYLDDNGNVDPAKVDADVAEILVERPGLKPRAMAYDPSQGMGNGIIRKPELGWGALLK